MRRYLAVILLLSGCVQRYECPVINPETTPTPIPIAPTPSPIPQVEEKSACEYEVDRLKSDLDVLYERLNQSYEDNSCSCE